MLEGGKLVDLLLYLKKGWDLNFVLFIQSVEAGLRFAEFPEHFSLIYLF